jgi:Domain of unknown function (DUF4345)
MKAFQWTLRVLALVPLLTGLMEALMGIGSLKPLGVVLPDATWTQASLDNNWRFLGTVWAGYAVLIVYATQDVLRHASLLRILSGVLFVSGLARAASVLLLGWPVAPFIGAMALELLGVPLLLVWLSILERTAQGATAKP